MTPYKPELRNIPLTFMDCPKNIKNICMNGDAPQYHTCDDRRNDPYHFIGHGCPRGFP